MKGDAINAIRYFDLAKQIKPNDKNLLSNMSILYRNIGDTQKADEYKKKADAAR